MRVRTRLRWIVLLALTIATTSSTMTTHAEVIDRVLAIVDGRLITLSDVRTTITLGLVPPALDAALERWINRVLVLQEVERFAPPDPAAAAIDQRVRDVEQRFGPEALASTLKALGVDEHWMRQWARDDLRVEAYIEQRFAGSMEPTEEELENYYREHRAEFPRDGGDALPADAQPTARKRVMAARRAALMADWLTALRRRADIVRTAPVAAR
jgi:hypothetical protein